MRLSDLQGISIPRMLAHIRLVAEGNKFNTNTPADLQPEEVSYSEVWGILIEGIDGYTLEDITSSPLAPPAYDKKKWRQIIQSAVDLAHEINKRGIIMQDCAPRNVVVDKSSHTPRVIDLAQCRFRDKLAERWQRWKWHEYDDWDPDIEYWEQVQGGDNPGAIGAVMINRVQKATGVKLEIDWWFKECEAIIAEIKRGKAEAAPEQEGGTKA